MSSTLKVYVVKNFMTVRGTLIPNMNTYGEADNSILVMDICSIHHSPFTIHHVDEIVELLQRIGILVIFVPPYSPDFNPIELTFVTGFGKTLRMGFFSEN